MCDKQSNDKSEILPLDTACLNIINHNEETITLYSIVNECYLCNGLKLTDLGANLDVDLNITTKYPVYMYYMKNEQQYCNITYSFKQYGYYGWNLTDGNCSSIYVINEPSNPYLPILAAFIIYVILGIVFATYKQILSKIKLLATRLSRRNENNTVENDNAISIQEISRKSTRVQSLDTFRGIAVLLMVFVNIGGGKYVFFNHSPWNGITVADFVLPWFAWITGFTLYRTIHTRLRLSTSRKTFFFLSCKRSLKLIMLGLMINSLHYRQGVVLNNLRFPGVLQLLGISYFICSLIETVIRKTQRNFHYGRLMFLEDILDSWPQWTIIISITITRTLILFLLPVPNCPKGYMGPGGYHNYGLHKNCTGGAVGYIDRYVFANHVYNSVDNFVYGKLLPHDPEGIMNIAGAVLIVYLGVQASKTVLYHQNFYLRIILWSITTGLIGSILCNFSKEDGIIPINKKMMSLSFVLVTSSSSFLLWVILHYVIDNKRYWTGAPFLYAGTNPIVIYVGHYVTKNVFPWSWKITGVQTHSQLLMMNLWTTSVWTIISYYLYIKDIIITI